MSATATLQEQKRMANPLLVCLELVLIDWWLKPLFALIYSATPFTMRKRISQKLNLGLSEKGVDLSGDSQEFIAAHRYSLIKDVEVSYVTKTPLRFILLAAALYMVWAVYPDFGGSASVPVNWLHDLSLLIGGLSFVAYFYGRWQVYKLSRVLI